MSEVLAGPVLVCGGGSGIGLRLAELLRAQGAAVGVVDRTIGDAARARLAHGPGPAVVFREADVTDGAGIAAAVDAVVAEIGAPRLAINSAGVQDSATFSVLDEERFRAVVDVNLVGSRNVAAAVLPHLARGSRLALIASLAGLVPNYGYAAYSASKFGVVGLAGCLRLEYAPRGVGVSVVCPPEVETPMVDEERRTGDPVALELKRFSGTLSVDDACTQILAGLAKGRTVVVPGRRARLTRLLAQVAPGLTNATSDRMVRRALASVSPR